MNPFNIYGIEKFLEIQVKIEEDSYKKLLKMVDTAGGHYGIVLQTQKKDIVVNLLEGDSVILFVEDSQSELYPFKAIKKVHEIN